MRNSSSRTVAHLFLAASLTAAPLAADEIPPLGLTGEEFTGSTTVGSPTESGYVRGTATRVNGGSAAWVAHTSTGGGARVGFWDASGIGEFTNSANNQQMTTALGLTEGGIIYGLSNRYVGATSQNQAAWVADASAATIESKRVGFTAGEYTSSAGVQYSTLTPSDSIDVTRYIGGTSRRYTNTTAIGQAAWIANVDTGVTTRVGFTGNEYTKSDGTQSSAVAIINSSGYFSGSSATYSTAGAASNFGGLWVGHVDNPAAITRVGLYGGEFISNTNVQTNTNVISLTEAGYWVGTATRYDGATARGNGAWVASAITGVTHRMGLWGAGYTANNTTQSSSVKNDAGNGAAIAFLNRGKVLGTSTRYNGLDDTSRGNAAWIADAATGVTKRLGLWDASGAGVFTSASTDEQNSLLFNSSAAAVIPFIISDYVWGYSQRYDETGAGAADNRTAWVYNFVTDTQTAFEISTNDADKSYSIINGVTDGGFAFGSYTLFDGSSSLNHAFIWESAFGVHDLNDLFADQLAGGGWNYLTGVTSVTENDGVLTLVGQGELVAGGTSNYSLTLDLATIPEPAAFAVLCGGIALACVITRRRVRRS